ncbi:hypothetical protein IX321_001509 [Bacteroides pyogenes]|nr:hypothetical protein [Bacteroides pyogenes]MBR8717254.1 hypothetical protein [Bacteroides pyogenes]MBR8746968.1 hypothetical protein [Bacteroides pyogenes]MBR8757351.1 hypothetical protein [Bacteroides pyogenes]MBR8780527.1 hypothetical protein [Bacteroides pyogenes]
MYTLASVLLVFSPVIHHFVLKTKHTHHSDRSSPSTMMVEIGYKSA